MLIAVGTWMLLNWLPLYFYDRFHLSLAMSGLSSSSLLQAAAILGAVVGGYISDRFTANSPTPACTVPCARLLLRRAVPAYVSVAIFAWRAERVHLLLLVSEGHWLGERVSHHLRSGRTATSFYRARHSEHDELSCRRHWHRMGRISEARLRTRLCVRHHSNQCALPQALLSWPHTSSCGAARNIDCPIVRRLLHLLREGPHQNRTDRCSSTSRRR